jgi:hypothetical protein
MKQTNHSISINILTDHHLESFIRCPNIFKRQYILSKNNSKDHWRQMVGLTVNKIIGDYYRLPINDKNNYYILKLIDQHWKHLHPNFFDNQIHYYTIAAKITDYLPKFLNSEQCSKQPLFLYERLQTFLEEIDIKLSVRFDVGEWSQSSFTVKKYLLTADENMVQLYKYLLTIFSKKTFGVLPDQIKLFSLLDGEVHLLYPNEQDIAKGLMYLHYLKNSMENPDQYIMKKNHLSDIEQRNSYNTLTKLVMH